MCVCVCVCVCVCERERDRERAQKRERERELHPVGWAMTGCRVVFMFADRQRRERGGVQTNSECVCVCAKEGGGER